METPVDPVPGNEDNLQSQSDSRQSARRRYVLEKWGLERHVILAVVSLLVAALVGYGLTDPGFSDAQQHTVFILVLAILLWLTEAVPPFAVGLLIICFQLVAYSAPLMNAEPIDAQKYLNTWSSSVIFLMLGGFFLAEGMRKTALDREIFKLAVKVFGRAQKNVSLGLMLTAAVLSMVMSNTATTAMLVAAVMPYLRTLDPGSGFRKAVLLGIPTAASVGGMGTIIGSAPNAVAVGALEQLGFQVSFLDWMLLGVPLSIVLCLGFWYALGRKYPWGQELVTLDLGSSDESQASRRARLIVIATTLLTIGLWLTSSLHSIPLATVSAFPVALLTVTGVLEARDMRGLPWDTLMLVAGGLSLGLAIVDFGVAEHYLGQFDLQGVRLFSLMLVFGFITVILSNVMSNTATASILIPIAGVLLVDMAPVITITVALCASAALMLPVSTPPNAIAFSTEMIRARDLRYGGLLIGGATPFLVIFWVYILREMVR